MYIVCTQNYVCTFLFLLLHAKYNCLLASYHFPAASVLLIISFETVFLNIMLHSGRKLEKIMLFSFKLNNKVSQLVHQRWPTLTFFIDILRSFIQIEISKDKTKSQNSLHYFLLLSEQSSFITTLLYLGCAWPFFKVILRNF